MKTGSFYIGQTKNPEERLLKHNNSGVKSTRSKIPWVIIHLEEYESKRDSLVREKKIKSYKGGREFKKLISGNSSDG